MGMDIKVVTAVFLTLLGVAVAMGAGQLSINDLEIPDFSFNDVTKFKDVFSRETVENGSIQVSGSFISQGTRSFTVAPTTVSLVMKDRATVTVNGMQLATPPQAEIVFTDFHGDISFGQRNVSVSGEAEGTRVNDITVNQTRSVTLEQVTIRHVEIDAVAVEELGFETGSGRITVDTGNTSQDMDLQNESLQLHDYQGMLRVTPAKQNRTQNSHWSYSVTGNVTQVVLPRSQITIG